MISVPNVLEMSTSRRVDICTFSQSLTGDIFPKDDFLNAEDDKIYIIQ
jgi:hypothetical protein